MNTYIYIKDRVCNIVVCNNIVEAFVLLFQNLGFAPDMEYVTTLDNNKKYIIENNQVKEITK